MCIRDRANVSFAIENEGDVICLLGPSGIGKTTILRTIAGLEKIKKGSIELKGNVLSSDKINLEPEDRNISLAFQENSLFPHYTVEKNILLGAERNKGKKDLSLIHISEPTRRYAISYAVFCLKKKILSQRIEIFLLRFYKTVYFHITL